MTAARSRVTQFALGGDGSRNYGLDVNGLRVLVTAPEGRHADGEALATEIAKLGPEAKPAREAPPPVEHETAPVPRHDFTVGQAVWCTVHGSEGPAKVTEVGAGRNRGRIKIAGLRSWCPAHNFESRS